MSLGQSDSRELKLKQFVLELCRLDKNGHACRRCCDAGIPAALIREATRQVANC